MRRILFTFLGIGMMAALVGQAPGGGRPAAITGKISGRLIDSLSGQPVEFASVVLLNATTQKQQDGAMTDEKGQFRFSELRPGTYELHISFLGYRNKTVKDIELTPAKPDCALPAISLLAMGVTLDAVEVTAEAAMVENRIDKLVYNAEKDLSSQGGDAIDVLRKAPLLTVDADGNVSLRGSSHVQILINGKPSTMFSGNVGEALRTIPADQIKSVEIITSPTARFDGEGSAGIINIVTRKKNPEGFTGSVNATAGNLSNRLGLGLSYGRGRFGLNFNGGGFYGRPTENVSDFRREDYIDGIVRILKQHGEGEGNYYGPRASLSVFYDINAYNQLTSGVNLRSLGRKSDQITLASFNDLVDSLYQEYQRTSETSASNPGFDWMTDYRRTFKKPEQELGFGFQISSNNNSTENRFYQVDLLGNAPQLNFNNFNENEVINLEYTLQGDYVHPFSPAVKLETGVKGILRRIDSDYSYLSLGDGVPIPDTADVFYYEQDVLAAYLSLRFKLGKNYGLIVGGRYEHTAIGGRYAVSPSSFDNTYYNFLPNLILNRRLGESSNLRLSYNRRIQRPSLYYINPYLSLNDPREISVGNPELEPELTDQFELGYNTYVKSLAFNASVYYRYTDQIIESYLTVTGEGISQTSFRNIGIMRSVGFNLFSSFNVSKVLTLSSGLDIFTYNAESRADDFDLSREAVMWGCHVNAYFNFPKDFRMEMSGLYYSPRQSLQGSQQAWSVFSLGGRKVMWEKRGSVGLSIWQPFSRTINFFSEYSGPNFRQRVDNRRVMRSLSLTFSYRFGKLDFQKQRERKGRVRNDDLKKVEDNDVPQQ